MENSNGTIVPARVESGLLIQATTIVNVMGLMRKLQLPFSCLAMVLALSLPAFVLAESQAAPYYAFSERTALLYDQIMELEIDAAVATSLAIKEEEPDNFAVYHLDNYIDFFRLYLTEDDELLNELLPNRTSRLNKLAQLPESSPWRNYALAEVRLHWAMIRIRFESYYPAFRDINKAHKLLRSNAKNFPDFLATYKDLGLLHAAVGAIPPQFKWAVELFSSLNGKIDDGAKEMKRALTDTSSPFYQETAVLYAFLQLHLQGKADQAWFTVNQLGLQPKQNKLHCFVLANIAMRSGRNDSAIALLSAQPRNRSSLDFPYLDFMLGLAKIRNLDTAASIYFQSFLSRFNGKHFIKEAAQKIAWCELLRGREAKYREQLSEISRRGNTTNGGDSNAAHEAQSGKALHLGLLRARLLFDGAYYKRARQEIDKIDQNNLGSQEHLELTYRTGRILHGLKDYAGALSFYESTIAAGRASDSFFACNAALQAGLIEEKRGNTKRARHYLEACLSMNPSDYKTGLHIQAKATLNRLK